MNTFILFLLIGFGSGLVIFPIGLFIYSLIKNTLERRGIKKLIKQGKMLIPLDSRDFNTEAWKNQAYGNIDTEKNKEELERLNDKIFHKNIENTDDNFMTRIKDYVEHARKQKFTDEQIKAEFRKKSYSEELINKIFEEV